MTKSTKNFKITAENNIFTAKTLVQLDNGERVCRVKLNAVSEREAINNLFFTLGEDVTYEEAKEYFENHKERI